MNSIRYEAMALTIVFLALAGIACAQFSSDGTIVYMGDLSMQASSHWSNQAARAPEATILGAAANNSTSPWETQRLLMLPSLPIKGSWIFQLMPKIGPMAA
ncbi:MAG: hypothetical protein LUQ15_07710 [Methanothrix sp.]|nr:hypothetical protein [Methanothrix sp.]